MNVQRLKELPPWAWVAASAVAGLGFLMWHRFSNDDDDTDWTTAKESQPGAVQPFPYQATGPAHGQGRPMQTINGFRERSYPGLLDVHFGMSLGGED